MAPVLRKRTFEQAIDDRVEVDFCCRFGHKELIVVEE